MFLLVPALVPDMTYNVFGGTLNPAQPNWYRLTRVVPDKFHRAVKRLCCVCVCVCVFPDSMKIHPEFFVLFC